METVTYTQLQQLVLRLPEAKLPLAYQLLAGLAESESEGRSPHVEFMRLPLDQRQRAMTRQAQEMLAHYEQIAAERETWQGGDFLDEG